MTTNVPSPTLGPTGFIQPTQSAILAGIIADIQAAFGGNLNLDPNNTATLTTPQGQLAQSFASIVGNTDELFGYYTTQTDPAYATGRMQDAIGRIYFMERLPSEPTVLQVVCSGLNGVTIPVGATVVDGSNNIYAATGSGQISNGQVVIQFAANVAGPTPVPNSILIYQAITGWDGVAIQSGVVGQNVETRQQFELRRQQSVASNSLGTLPAILGAVLQVPGVLDAYVTENATNGTLTVQGTALVPHSVYVAVYGGSAAAIAQAIWTKKPPGANYNGNTTVTVQDTNSGYSAPLPSYQVSFEIPPPLQVAFLVNLVANAQVPSNALQLIQQAILSAFAGGDGGPRARIGSTILASRFYGPVTALGSGASNWVQIRSITIGSPNLATATFTGSIGGSAGGTGTTLTVSSLSGTIGIGNIITDGTAGFITSGTQILAQLTGTLGGSGTYTVSNTLHINPEPVTAFGVAQTSIAVNINQEPITLAPLISVNTS